LEIIFKLSNTNLSLLLNPPFFSKALIIIESLLIEFSKNENKDINDIRENNKKIMRYLAFINLRKDSRYKGKVEIGDELIMVDRNSPAYGRKGKVVRLTQDGVEVDFGRGDKYGIISRRIKGNKITA